MEGRGKKDKELGKGDGFKKRKEGFGMKRVRGLYHIKPVLQLGGKEGKTLKGRVKEWGRRL